MRHADLATIVQKLESNAFDAVDVVDAGASREEEQSVAYLASDAALESLSRDPYWPKWDSPWWHMLLLHERGQTHLIPRSAVDALVAALNRMRLKIFPIHQSDAPPDFDPYVDASCHCAMGCILPLLSSCGVDIDARLPWAHGWFPRYQMADGGLTCDNDAYLVDGEVPSSMVGTVAPLEAMLALTRVRSSEEESAFIHRAVDFLVGRALVRGSDTVHNAAERDSARAWTDLTFPRFYFYDVLRGLAVLVEAAHRLQRRVPWAAMCEVVELLESRFPDGKVRIGRRALTMHGTRLPDENGRWTRKAPASSFPLLEASSRIGEVSPALTRNWRATRSRLISLAQAGLINERTTTGQAALD